MTVASLRKLAGREEIDYFFLLSALQGYARPRDKISAWIKAGDLIRVKKGLYVFGQSAAQAPYCLEILTNLIYGPSALSLSYALAFYGLIPERVSVVTSITPKRYKKFSTPVGYFSYNYLSPKKYAVGINLQATSAHRQFLIASPEKALCDQLVLADKALDLKSLAEIEAYLGQDLRIDEVALRKFDLQRLAEIAHIYQDKKLTLLLAFLKKWKK